MSLDDQSIAEQKGADGRYHCKICSKSLTQKIKLKEHIAGKITTFSFSEVKKNQTFFSFFFSDPSKTETFPVQALWQKFCPEDTPESSLGWGSQSEQSP